MYLGITHIMRRNIKLLLAMCLGSGFNLTGCIWLTSCCDENHMLHKGEDFRYCYGLHFLGYINLITVDATQKLSLLTYKISDLQFSVLYHIYEHAKGMCGVVTM